MHVLMAKPSSTQGSAMFVQVSVPHVCASVLCSSDNRTSRDFQDQDLQWFDAIMTDYKC